MYVCTGWLIGVVFILKSNKSEVCQIFFFDCFGRPPSVKRLSRVASQQGTYKLVLQDLGDGFGPIL